MDDIGSWYDRRRLEMHEAYAEMMAARSRYWAAVEERESVVLIRSLAEDARRAAEAYERAAYAGD